MQDFLNFFKLDLYQLVENLRPFILSWGWFFVPIIAFSRSIPIIGLITNRIPVFMALCLFSTELWQILILVILFSGLGLFGDILTYTKMSKYWLKLIDKIPSESKTDKILFYFKKRPILVSILGTYSAYTSCLLTPFAKKYGLNILNFWIPRTATNTISLLTYGLLYFILGINIKFLNDILGKFGLVIVVGIIIGIAINLIYGLKFISDIKLIKSIKSKNKSQL